MEDMSITYKEIDEKLKEILKNRFDLNLHDENLLEKNLLGKEIRLQARDLVYIFFDVENTFNIKIKEEYVVSNKFTTFNNIRDIVCQELSVFVE